MRSPWLNFKITRPLRIKSKPPQTPKKPNNHSINRNPLIRGINLTYFTGICLIGFLLMSFSRVGFCVEDQPNQLSLNSFLTHLYHHHPLFEQEQMSVDRAQFQLQAIAGDQDWLIKHSSFYQHAQDGQTNPSAPQKHTRFNLSSGLNKTFWGSGTQLGITHDYTQQDLYFDFSPNLSQNVNTLSANVAIPLLKNRQGQLSRLNYELQAFEIDLNRLNAQEVQESFLESLGVQFIQWALLIEQQQIAQNRLDIAKAELTRTRRKRDSRLVAEVDLLSAKEAVSQAKAALQTITVQSLGLQAHLSEQSLHLIGTLSQPDYPLYALPKVNEVDAVLALVKDKARVLSVIDQRLAQSGVQYTGQQHHLRPELNLVLNTSIKSDASELDDAFEVKHPSFGVGLDFAYPLGNRRARQTLAEIGAQKRQLQLLKQQQLHALLAKVREQIVQMNELKTLLELNQRQIQISKRRTKAELKQHNQGKRELSFVLLSRDAEQAARLTYAQNAAQYHQLWLSHQALTDQLLHCSSQDNDACQINDTLRSD